MTSALLMILLIVSVLFSSTGIYYTRHFCHGNPTGLRLFNSVEITGKCNCKAEAFDAHGCLKTISADNCCVEFDHYIKSEIQSEKHSAYRINVVIPVAEYSLEPITDERRSIVQEVKYYNNPPPVSPAGKQIVILNHSLRIPLS